jgi:hypothetical protein
LRREPFLALGFVPKSMTGSEGFSGSLGAINMRE